ncbi:MAG: transglutaminase family protein [Cyclobacteriaceae bacterium]|nr:transglutaminase family protein [Cyclobacteriaceae bacterium]
MSQFKIRHITRYLYEDVVRDSANQIMLYPILDDYQDVKHHSIQITDRPIINTHIDYYGNKVGTFTNAHPHRELTIDSQLLVITQSRPVPTDVEPQEKQWKDLEMLRHRLEFIDFLKHERFNAFDEIEKVIEEERCKNCTPLVAAQDFCKYVYDNFTYKKGITTVETTVDEIWKIKSGVCQDFAHMLLVMLRQINIPARYVSGYICPKKSGMRGEGATHAWVEAYIPSYGWLGLDPTNNCVVNDAHVKLAVGKNFSDCSPVRGTYRGTSNHTLEVGVSVEYEDGRTSQQENELVYNPPVTSVYKNSFRKHQEMQMQQ